MKTNLISIISMVLGGALFLTCQSDNQSEFEQLALKAKSMETVADMACDACNGVVIFGPQDFIRLTGKPTAYHRMFNLDETTELCLTATKEVQANVSIAINGIGVIANEHFSETNNYTVQIFTQLGAGVHDVAITMKGKPGAMVTLTLKGCLSAPPAKICSEAAREACEGKGWMVSAVYPSEGTLVCTIDGRADENNCDTCPVYNILVWKDGATEHYCPPDGTFTYSTVAGQTYAGHLPCTCGDNLYNCGWSWDMQNCIPD